MQIHFSASLPHDWRQVAEGLKRKIIEKKMLKSEAYDAFTRYIRNNLRVELEDFRAK